MRNIKQFILSLEGLSNFEVLAKCEAAGLEKLGKGSSRVVYAINDHKVIKIALSDAGREQNTTEVMTWEYIDDNYPSYKKLFAKVFFEYCHKWDHFIVMERLVKKHSDKKIPLQRISSQVIYYTNKHVFGAKLNKQVAKYFNAVESLDVELNTSNMLDMHSRNFGYSSTGQAKILDYGFNNECLREYGNQNRRRCYVRKYEFS